MAAESGRKRDRKTLVGYGENGIELQDDQAASFQKVNVDTTVQEKAVAYPTDAKLLNQIRGELVKRCDYAGMELRNGIRG